MLPDGWAEAELVDGAASRGLGLEGLADYAMPGAVPRPPSLVVGYGTPSQHLWPAALDALAEELTPRPVRATREG